MIFSKVIYFLLDIVDLRCCVSFRYTAKWISYTYTYTHSFLGSFPLWAIMGFPGGSDSKESTCDWTRRLRFNPWVGKISWRRTWQPTPVFLPGEFPWTEEPGRLQCTGSQRVGHNWVSKHSTAQHIGHYKILSRIPCAVTNLNSILKSRDITFPTKVHMIKALVFPVGFPSSLDGKASAYNVGDPGSIPGSGRSPGEGNGNPLQYSCLENPMDRGAWWATVHGVAKSRTWLSDFSLHFSSWFFQ